MNTRRFKLALITAVVVKLTFLSPAWGQSSGTWVTKQPLQTPRAGHGSAVLGGKVYVAGGYTSSGITSALEVYDPTTNSWSTNQSMGSARNGVGLVALNGLLYAIGGDSPSGMLASVESYDPATDSWTPRGSMLSTRYYPAVGVIGGKIYACAGDIAAQQNGSSVEEYDPQTNMWTSRESMPTPVRYVGATAVVNDLLYVISGESEVYADAVRCFNPATNSWSLKAPIPTLRSLAAAAVINGEIYVAGGYFVPIPGLPATSLTNLDIYNPVTNSWRAGTPMPTGRVSCAGSAVDGVLFVSGGGVGGQPGVLNVVEAHQLAGPFTCDVLPPLAGGVDNLIKVGQTVPIKLTVKFEGVLETGVSATIDRVVQIDGTGTPITNEVINDSGLSADGGTAFRFVDNTYVFNLSTKGWATASGARFKVTIKITKAGHVDTAYEVVLKNK